MGKSDEQLRIEAELNAAWTPERIETSLRELLEKHTLPEYREWMAEHKEEIVAELKKKAIERIHGPQA